MHEYLPNSFNYSELYSELVLTLKKLQVTDFPRDSFIICYWKTLEDLNQVHLISIDFSKKLKASI